MTSQRRIDELGRGSSGSHEQRVRSECMLQTGQNHLFRSGCMTMPSQTLQKMSQENGALVLATGIQSLCCADEHVRRCDPAWSAGRASMSTGMRIEEDEEIRSEVGKDGKAERGICQRRVYMSCEI